MVQLLNSRKRSTSYHKEGDEEFKHQVGGHHQLHQVGRLHLAKPSGVDERDFYLHAPPALIPHLAHMCGYTEGSSETVRPSTSTMCDNCLLGGSAGQSRLTASISRMRAGKPSASAEYVVLSDLTAGFRHPCIVDLKMGTRQHGDAAAPEKIRRQTDKCARSTSLLYGLRLCGLQYYDACTERSTVIDKYEGRRIEVLELWKAIKGFFSYPDGRLRTALIRALLRKIEAVEEAVQSLDGVRLFGSSLLVIYEGDETLEPLSDEEADKQLCVRIVDFANATLGGGLHSGADEGFLLGLHSLHRFIDDLAHHSDSDVDSEGSMSP
ncbi:unnamed protein product, partial [Mesorhabditis spiculigera]